MRSWKTPVILLVIVVVAVVSAWYWRGADADPDPARSDERDLAAAHARDQNEAGSDPSPPVVSASGSSGRPDLHVARTNANDFESTRSFKEASDCLRYHAARRELAAVLNDERLDDLSRETLATLENLDRSSSKHLAAVRLMEDACFGSSEDALALSYIDSILEAALSGDPDAESCFVISNVAPTKKVSASSAWMSSLMDRYVTYAPTFTANALERGDPYVAANALYRYIASPTFHPSALDSMQKADPHLTRRMASLAALRALPEQRVRLEYGLAEFDKLKLLTDSEIAQADEWARTAYAREFSDQPAIDLDSHAPCYSSPELAP